MSGLKISRLPVGVYGMNYEVLLKLPLEQDIFPVLLLLFWAVLPKLSLASEFMHPLPCGVSVFPLCSAPSPGRRGF